MSAGGPVAGCFSAFGEQIGWGLGQTQVRFTVNDTGIGIPGNKLGPIFEAFTQVDGAATRAAGGTGLGLSISRQLVELMGGELQVRSEFGSGSTFWFEIPLTVAPIIRTDAIEQRLLGARVLIVDDVEANREILTEYLEEYGAVCMNAAGGNEALELVRENAQHQHEIDLVLVDFHMPEMDGVQLALRISDVCGRHVPPMILLSSAAQLGGMDETVPSIVVHTLTKPIKRRDLLMAIGGAIASKHDLVEASAVSAASNELPFKGLTVLIAEDVLVNREVVNAYLELQSVRCLNAADGIKAVEAFREQAASIDLIFMDCHMPGMDGFEATRMIRQIETDRNLDAVPIVALTANALVGDEEVCRAAGMDDYLSKPFTEEQLLEKLRAWTSLNRIRAQA